MAIRVNWILLMIRAVAAAILTVAVWTSPADNIQLFDIKHVMGLLLWLLVEIQITHASILYTNSKKEESR
jgi:hypothetical protein